MAYRMSIKIDNQISDTGLVVAYIRMMQIMEDDMSVVEIPSVLELLKSVERKDAEIERLNALVAMHAEALLKIRRMPAPCSPDGIDRPIFNQWMQSINIARDALSASSDTISAYKREVQAEVLEKAASHIDLSIDGEFFYIADCKNYLIRKASELRAKGE